MILELSTRCAPSEAFAVSAKQERSCQKQNIDLSGEQAAQTKEALDFFSERFRAAGE